MKFEGKLEVGMLAMIINTRHEGNKSLIGSIVTVERMPARGEDITDLFPTATNIIREAHPDIVVCSGVTALAPTTSSCGNVIRNGYVRISRKNLMPLPPLEEEEVQKERELELS